MVCSHYGEARAGSIIEIIIELHSLLAKGGIEHVPLPLRNFCPTIPKTVVSYGSRHQHDTFWAAVHEAISVLTKKQGNPPIVQPPEEDKGNTQRALLVPHLGSHTGGMLSSQDNDYCVSLTS